MIWFSNPGGRTGNQLFQYAFIESIRRPGEMVFTTHLKKFMGQFKVRPGYHSFENFWVARTFEKLLDPLMYHGLVRTRIVSSWDDEESVPRFKKGLLTSLVFIKGYFQNEAWLNDGRRNQEPLFRKEALAEARDFLDKVPQGRVPAFLHIRRGDYLHWTVLGQRNPTLPMAYYREAVDRILRSCPEAYFLVTTDDPRYARENFSWLGDYLVSDHSPVTDLAVMAGCPLGILSNSTLAWWGGYWMKERLLVLAPECWLGFRSGCEYPPGITPRWAQVVPKDLWYAH